MFHHVPVLKNELLENLFPSTHLIKKIEDLKQNEIVVVDCTLGGAGHTTAFIEKFLSASELSHFKLKILGFDQDEVAVSHSQVKLEALHQNLHPERWSFEIVNQNFSELKNYLETSLKGQKIHYLYADLGVSSPQLDDGERGFSFVKSGPFDMRMDRRQSLTAQKILQTYNEKELTTLFFEYGEEPKARLLARQIVSDRKSLAFDNTLEVAEYFKKILNYYNSKTHPATRAFQALRIEVNQELAAAETLLRDIPSLMDDDGKVGIITFHSLEDRLIKRKMRHWQELPMTPHEKVSFELSFDSFSKKSLGKELPRGGIIPNELEMKENPRSRSARLRCFQFNMSQVPLDYRRRDERY